MELFMSICMTLTSTPVDYIMLIGAAITAGFGHIGIAVSMILAEIVSIIVTTAAITKKLNAHDAKEIQLTKFTPIPYTNITLRILDYKVYIARMLNGDHVLIISKKVPDSKDRFIHFMKQMYINKNY